MVTVKHPARQVINPNQTQANNRVTYGVNTYIFDKEQGYIFTMDEEHDEAIEYFTKELGYTIKNIGPKPNKSEPEVEKKFSESKDKKKK
jgi:hypothetical protein